MRSLQRCPYRFGSCEQCSGGQQSAMLEGSCHDPGTVLELPWEGRCKSRRSFASDRHGRCFFTSPIWEVLAAFCGDCRHHDFDHFLTG